jgi:tRNA threonylcarbamoyl adenosine modification protein YeaZ
MGDVLLALDTCTRRASIALRDHTTLRAEMTWEAQRHETATVAGRVKELMRACHIAPQDLGCVAVAIGPGSFTGVRCGLAIGKGVSVARGLPMVSVTAFDVLAHAQPPQPMPLLAVLEIGRNRVVTCPYEWHEGAWGVAGEWRTWRWEELINDLTPPLYVCGELTPTFIAACAQRVTIAPAALNMRRAGFLAELGLALWRSGEVGNPATLTAVYLS